LDGVRAVAVLVVMAFHVHTPGFSAGFLGVDAFFVLSGYLITGVLLRDVKVHGQVRLANFWSRRVRRLLPAVLVMVTVIVTWGAFFAPRSQRDALRIDVIATLLNSANWRFISSSSYFSGDGLISPLEHTWSLAVEEQFYLFWPVMISLAVLAVLAVRRRRHAAKDGPVDVSVTRVVAVLSATLIVISVGLLAWLFDSSAPERAYMGTDARAFEPLLGALLACLVTSERFRATARRYAGAAIVLGLTGLALGVLVLGAGGATGTAPAYYRGGALAVTAACGLLVLGAAQGRPGNPVVRTLGNPAAAWLGRISYGVYLWHWPFALWLLPPGGVFSPKRALAVVALTIATAAASFYLVEQRVQSRRAAGWLTPRRLIWVIPMVLALGIGTAGAAVKTPTPAPGSLRQRVLLLGDSVPSRLSPALVETTLTRGWQIQNGAKGACPALGVTITDSQGALLDPNINCGNEIPPLQTQTIKEFKPTIIVAWSRYEMADRLSNDGKHLVAGTAPFWAAQRASLRTMIDRLALGGAKVVIVKIDRPGQGIATRCTPAACPPILKRLVSEDGIRVAWNKILVEEAARDPRVRVIGIDDVYCKGTAEPCNDKLANGTFARPDGSHFSEEYMPVVAEALAQRIAVAVARH
jgi:peptidoglycan/LPS O-acetylase OafA/YrhL